MAADHVEVTLIFPAPADPLSMNDGDGREQGRRKQAWRDAACYRWIEAHPGKGPRNRGALTPAVVRVALPFVVGRRRDPINYARTVKHIVDGLVLAGAWPDDTPEFVSQEIPTLYQGTDVIIRITERTEP